MSFNKFIDSYTFEEAFKSLNKKILNQFEFKTESRNGYCLEIGSIFLEVHGPTVDKAIFSDERINRIDYSYAEDFWDFMISGGTDAKEAFKEYPHVAKFLEKPKNPELPENFNTFYGPRIVAQLPAILKELKEQKNSRRAVIQILQEKDQILLDSNENLEYPCTDSITYYIRDGHLYTHCHMRSQNCATVLQLDLYLQYKLLEYIAKECNVQIGTYVHSIVSAHLFERDIEYVKGFL